VTGLVVAAIAGALTSVSAAGPAPAPGMQRPVLRLATTTSTVDTGLLAAILPDFERRCGCRVDVVAVGTGQALEIGRRGDADVLLVHARKAEDQFVAERHARERFDVMYNDFVIVGPAADPAAIAGLTTAREAFAAVARAGAPFVSRGDRSGTHTVELDIWTDLRPAPSGAPWYKSVGQGMGETLVVANEQRAYALTDRATWLAMSAKLPALRLLVGGARLSENADQDLRNAYGVLAVNPDAHPGVQFTLATGFVEWLLSPGTQRTIGRFGVERFGQPLYYADSDEYKATRELSVTIGGKSTTFTLDALRALSRVTLSRHTVVGVKKGPLGPYTWTGASLKDVLTKADPSIAGARYAGSRIVITSSDGWTVTVWWQELFGAVPRGLALYNVKGCNECHGVAAEGTAPSGKRPAPALAGNDWPEDATLALLRAGRDRHAGLNPYTERQLSRADVAALLAWLKSPHSEVKGNAYVPPVGRAASVLAYERDGKPLGATGGLIQLIVGPDEFAGRYSHWVKSIEVVAAAQAK